MKHALFSIILSGATLLACGSSDHAIGARATPSTAEPGAGSPSPSASADPARQSASPPAPCTADEICFDVVPIRPGPKPLAGRLVVFWVQLDDDGPDPTWKKAYEVAFSGTERRIAIPRSAILPPDDVHLLCDRAC